MKTTGLLGLLLVLIAGAAVIVWWRSGPQESDFAHLKQPRVTRMNDQRMLVVAAEGNPGVVAGRAFKLLFSTYYRLDGISRAGRPPAPRARWPHSPDKAGIEPLGRYALPVPDAATSVPAQGDGGLRIAIETWPYGEVAEILHVGPYNAEQADIKRLMDFVASQGYSVAGDHEEEYVKGPGMIFAGNPDRYLTIIRVQVRKADRLQD